MHEKNTRTQNNLLAHLNDTSCVKTLWVPIIVSPPTAFLSYLGEVIMSTEPAELFISLDGSEKPMHGIFQAENRFSRAGPALIFPC